jgi:hypothetical protein
MPSTPWWVAAVSFLVLYVGVNIIYGASTIRPELPAVDEQGQAVLYVSPVGLVPTEGRIRSELLIQPPEDLLEGGRWAQTVRVNLLSITRTITFEQGTRDFSADFEVITPETSFEMYPFDHYQVPLWVVVTVEDDQGQENVIPSDLVVWGKFPGWRVEPTTSRDTDLAALGFSEQDREDFLSSGNAATVIDVARNGSTMSIVLLLLAAMIVLTALALIVARSVATRRRRIEATMASWFAALLFAMVPLRTNMPGAPPIGVWIDFLVFLWVLLGLMAALSLFIGSWLRYSPPVVNS